VVRRVRTRARVASLSPCVTIAKLSGLSRQPSTRSSSATVSLVTLLSEPLESPFSLKASHFKVGLDVAGVDGAARAE
jgi:hypothetical protein